MIHFSPIFAKIFNGPIRCLSKCHNDRFTTCTSPWRWWMGKCYASRNASRMAKLSVQSSSAKLAKCRPTRSVSISSAMSEMSCHWFAWKKCHASFTQKKRNKQTKKKNIQFIWVRAWAFRPDCVLLANIENFLQEMLLQQYYQSRNITPAYLHKIVCCCKRTRSY